MSTSLSCGSCREPMQRVTARGHYGRPVEIDWCGPCHLLWFDPVEAARLSGAGMVDLVGAMASAQALPHRALDLGLRCARCAGPVKTVTNRSRFGVAEQRECAQGHGTWSSFGQWLSERGLVRAPTPADRVALLADPSAPWCCTNCGAALADPLPAQTVLPAATEACRHCGTAVAVLNWSRFAAALDPEGATSGTDLHGGGPGTWSMPCHACGHAGTDASRMSCEQCGATRLAADLATVHRRLQVLLPLLEGHQSKPAPAVVARRLEGLRGNLDRQREHAEALRRSSGQDVPEPTPRPGTAAGSWLDALEKLGRLRSAVIALVALLAWGLSQCGVGG